MRYTQPKNTTDQPIGFSTVKIQGCSDVTVGFDILDSAPTVAARRYCNKVLVHECVAVPEILPTELTRVEFMATDDPCYKYFKYFKSSALVDSISPTVTLQLDADDLVIGILVNFSSTETNCAPLRLTYKLWGYPPTGARILLSQGNLFVSPCNNGSCDDSIWTDINW